MIPVHYYKGLELFYQSQPIFIITQTSWYRGWSDICLFPDDFFLTYLSFFFHHFFNVFTSYLQKAVQSNSKDKSDRKANTASENLRKTKAQSFNAELHQAVSLREFSSSVVSHTTSSAAKCKTSSPKTPDNNRGHQRNKKHFDKDNVRKSCEFSTSNLVRKTAEMYTDFGKSDLLISYKPPQAVIAPRSDKKITNLTKPGQTAARSARSDSKGYKQKTECVPSNALEFFIYILSEWGPLW